MATSYPNATGVSSPTGKAADAQADGSICAACRQPNCDVQIVGCGCTVHTVSGVGTQRGGEKGRTERSKSHCFRMHWLPTVPPPPRLVLPWPWPRLRRPAPASRGLACTFPLALVRFSNATAVVVVIVVVRALHAPRGRGSAPQRSHETVERARAVPLEKDEVEVWVSGSLVSAGSNSNRYTCLPLDVVFVRQTLRTNYLNQQPFCPCCRRSPIVQISVLPLPIDILEEAARLREKDNAVLSIHNNGESSSSSANSIALFNGTHKRALASRAATACRSYRTGRWASEESAYTDKLIKSFDAGLLPLPHGIKLNDFLCDLLSCRTSRLTKKLKNAKLSARTYRSLAGGGGVGITPTGGDVGGDIQRAQTLFLKSVTPDWVRMELQFNISRMWRTHLANFCLQISYLQLETKEWFASLDAIDYIAKSCSDTKLQAKRKRMRSALAEDANAAAGTLGTVDAEASSVDRRLSVDEGVFVSGLPVRVLSSRNLQGLADEGGEAGDSGGSLRVDTGAGGSDELSQQQRERVDSVNGSIAKESSAARARKFSFESSILEESMRRSTSIASFVELFNTPEIRPAKAPASRRTSAVDIGATAGGAAGAGAAKDDGELEASASDEDQRPGSEVKTIIDEAIDSVLESSSCNEQYQGLFLREISKFLAQVDSPFRLVDLWVPMNVSHSDDADGGEKHIGGSSGVATTTSGGGINGIIYGAKGGSSVRLSNAGYITVQSPPQVMNRLNEFGMYSKNFSFSPGFGLPGRVYLSRIPCWENNLSLLRPEHFARVGGAKIYGVNTCLSIPVNTPVGTIVVSLYSNQNLTRDPVLEKKCMERFWKLRPKPKWKLTIDVGLKAAVEEAEENPPVEQDPASSPRIPYSSEQTYVIPPSPVPDTPQPSKPLPPSNPSATPTPAPYLWNEQSLALLLGKYMPLDRNSTSTQPAANPAANNRDVAGSLMSLRLLLLRQSSCRTNAESKLVDIIVGKYQSYMRANKREHDLILSIVNDWKRLATSAQARSSARKANYGQNQSSTVSDLTVPDSSPMTLPTSSSVFMGISSAHESPYQSMISSAVNQYMDNFSLPLASSWNNGAGSIPQQSKGSLRQQIEEQNNVPRVVSEQGPIEGNGEGQ
ncbi:hypothetical protein ACHAWF_019025 [Thalassiosira exigua]